jgi:hypothetical protein
MRLIPVLIFALFTACFGATTGPGPKPPAETGEPCTSHLQCGSGNKCELGRCKSCEALDCAEIGDGGTIPPLAFGPAPGCASGMGFVIIAGRAYACPGVFARGKQDQQCSSGYRKCVDSNGIRQVATGLENFFASAQPGIRQGVMKVCGFVGPASEVHYIFGVGGAGKQRVSASTFPPCGGWTDTYECDSSGSPGMFWRCPLTMPNSNDQDFDNISNEIPEDGTLCCNF